MTLKAGSRGYIRLGDSFDAPQWREAVVVAIQEEWLQCLVRCNRDEVARSALSHVDNDEGIFCLVETPFHKLLSGVSGEFRALDAEVKELLKEGLKMVHSEEELTYATASDPQAPRRSKEKPPKTKGRRTSSQSSSGTSSEDEGDLADALRKKWLGGGTSAAKKERGSSSDSRKSQKKSSKFAMIERKSRRGGKDRQQDKMNSEQAMLHAAASSGDPLQGLLALQLAQQFKSNQRRSSGRRRKSTRSSSRSSSSSESDRDHFDRSLKGHSRAGKDYQSSKKRMFKNPVKHVRRYVRAMREELGAEEKPFRIVDYNRRIHWGKNRTLQKCHYLVSIILEELLREEPERAALRATLTLQALHQTCLDNGSWDVGWLLTHVENPFEKRLFGGDPQSLQNVTSYLKSMNELAKTTQGLRAKGYGKGDQEDQEPVKEGKGNKRGQKNKDKEKGQQDA